ncbi:hypothetical protein PCANC_14496 [Puccinia coronata f. sp. avenae]|uniref:Uncharacterized protein n=1 Tax=Puccinia coronata f. sp. avenae TaxID=200324 RepID=A0A2N5SM02_9BASI|nr:hypothetical protein PCANC_14496 [Puccinia coronata f. sp. avenae]
MTAANFNHTFYPEPLPPPPAGSYYQNYPNSSSQVIPHDNSLANSNIGLTNDHHTHEQHIHQQANHQATQEDNSLASGTLATPDVATHKKDATHTSRPNLRQINHLLKSLAKDRQLPAPLPADQLAPVPVSTGSHPNVDPNCAANPLIPHINNIEERKQCEDEQQEDERLPELPNNVMEEISAMNLDELREFKALHATSRQLPAYLKAELDETYYEFERHLHIMAIRNQLHATLLYTHIGQTNQMRGATNYNNFCRFDPHAREIFSAKEQELKQRCKEVAKVWNAMDPEIKMKLLGRLTWLNLASNKKSVQFVRQWAKETTEQLNKIAACHSIQGFLVISSARSSGDLYIQGGSRMGVSFLNMLVCSGDPLRKFHTYVAGMSVAEELTGGEVTVCPTKTSQKRKHAKITGTQNVDGKTPKRDKYCLGTLKENKNTISKQLLAILRSAGVKKFWGWPGKNGARDLKAAHVTVQIKPNDDDFHAHELFQPINAIEIESSYRETETETEMEKKKETEMEMEMEMETKTETERTLPKVHLVGPSVKGPPERTQVGPQERT